MGSMDFSALKGKYTPEQLAWLERTLVDMPEANSSKPQIEDGSTENELASTTEVAVEEAPVVTEEPVAEQVVEQIEVEQEAQTESEEEAYRVTRDDIDSIKGRTVFTSHQPINFKSKSEMFVWLHTEVSLPVGEIARLSDNHYSFVYGALQNAGVLSMEGEKLSKTDLIKELEPRARPQDRSQRP